MAEAARRERQPDSVYCRRLVLRGGQVRGQRELEVSHLCDRLSDLVARAEENADSPDTDLWERLDSRLADIQREVMGT